MKEHGGSCKTATVKGVQVTIYEDDDCGDKDPEVMTVATGTCLGGTYSVSCDGGKATVTAHEEDDKCENSGESIEFDSEDSCEAAPNPDDGVGNEASKQTIVASTLCAAFATMMLFV
jgi:hypothetical protein